ncbi:MAG: 3-oxoacyl-ACP synthase [Acidobacteriota bacterium]|nr:3-oxoacyl-ACP synthase [Acidobacteriota bacterium]
MTDISLSRIAVWLPEGYEDAAFISRESGVPEEIVRTKMGVVRKCRAQLEDHPSLMAIRAARKVLEGLDPDSIDLVVWTGSDYKDYPVWTASVYVQEQLGLRKAWAFDIAARCSTNVVALKVIKNQMIADPSIKRALLCGGHRTGDLVNYKDPKARFLYSLSDGGSAILLERGDENPILGSAVMTDGSFSEDVILPAGGTRNRIRKEVRHEYTYLNVPDIQGMRERLADRSIENFSKVIKDTEAASNCGPIDYLALLHLKRSAHDAILAEAGVTQEQSIYMDHFGHFGAPDQVVSLALAEQYGKVKPGDHVMLASAGIGYCWSALSFRWDRPTYLNNDVILEGVHKCKD